MKKLVFLFILLLSLNAFTATCIEYIKVFETRTIVTTGTYVNKVESVAINLATTMALNKAAKQAGEVIQKEDTTLYNDKVHMVIQTKASNIVDGYQVLSEEYDKSTGRAEVTIKIEGKQLAGQLCKLLKIY